MAHAHSNLLRLVDLAKETSSDKRRELLREMTDLFMEAPESHSERENAQFGDILGAVAHEMEMEVRQTLATRLANVPNAPRSLIVQLANDEINVARPVLAQSIVLQDTDLVALAKIKGQDHLHAIAGRKTISAVVSDALVARGDDRVLTRLAQNGGAELSRNAMETLTDKAENVEPLRRPMVTRADIPADLLNQMFFAVSSELRRVIMERMGSVDPALIDGAIRQTERRMKMRAAAPDPEQVKADAFMASLAKSGPITESLLVNLAKQKRQMEVAMVFARLTQLDLKTAKRVLTEANPESLAIASRACRFDRQTFSTLVLSREDESRSLSAAYELLELYDKVPVETAQRVMRFWRVRVGTGGEQAAA
ncbi:hypothetical protein sos41_32060 [Alphaproteobacteria bacterium SO-S41]|nr:hypothetical protein sos41_32060 [Alphaproteobacteria bacterium SO-S41]